MLLYRWHSEGLTIWPRYHHTQSKHNGTWDVRGTVQYRWWNDYDEQENPILRTVSTEPTPDPAPGPWRSVAPFEVITRDLLVKDVSPEYLVFDPQSSSTPQISYTLDKLVNENCTVTIDIYTTSQQLMRTMTFRAA